MVVEGLDATTSERKRWIGFDPGRCVEDIVERRGGRLLRNVANGIREHLPEGNIALRSTNDLAVWHHAGVALRAGVRCDLDLALRPDDVMLERNGPIGLRWRIDRLPPAGIMHRHEALIRGAETAAGVGPLFVCRASISVTG